MIVNNLGRSFEVSGKSGSRGQKDGDCIVKQDRMYCAVIHNMKSRYAKRKEHKYRRKGHRK
jgi:hypothetical protein